jgi:hypothetical protein
MFALTSPISARGLSPRSFHIISAIIYYVLFYYILYILCIIYEYTIFFQRQEIGLLRIDSILCLEICILQFICSIVRAFKANKIRWEKHVARMNDMRMPMTLQFRCSKTRREGTARKRWTQVG